VKCNVAAPVSLRAIIVVGFTGNAVLGRSAINFLTQSHFSAGIRHQNLGIPPLHSNGGLRRPNSGGRQLLPLARSGGLLPLRHKSGGRRQLAKLGPPQLGPPLQLPCGQKHGQKHGRRPGRRLGLKRGRKPPSSVGRLLQLPQNNGGPLQRSGPLQPLPQLSSGGQLRPQTNGPQQLRKSGGLRRRRLRRTGGPLQQQVSNAGARLQNGRHPHLPRNGGHQPRPARNGGLLRVPRRNGQRQLQPDGDCSSSILQCFSGGR